MVNCRYPRTGANECNRDVTSTTERLLQGINFRFELAESLGRPLLQHQ